MPANDALELARLRGNRQGELERRIAMGSDPQANPLLRMLMRDQDEDPYTGVDERERIGGIQSDLDEQAQYMSPGATEVREDMHGRALAKLFLPLQMKMQEQQRAADEARQLELMRQTGDITREGMRQTGSMDRAKYLQGEQNTRQRERLSATDRQNQLYKKSQQGSGESWYSPMLKFFGMGGAPTAPAPAPMMAEDEGGQDAYDLDTLPPEYRDAVLAALGGR